MNERELHISVVTFLRVAMPPGILFFHIPNGELRDLRTAQKLKAFGTLAGVPDLAFVLPTGRAGFIELKAGANKLTPAQIAFRDTAVEAGACFAECRSVAEVEEALAAWLAPFNIALRARVAA